MVWINTQEITAEEKNPSRIPLAGKHLCEECKLNKEISRSAVEKKDGAVLTRRIPVMENMWCTIVTNYPYNKRGSHP